MSKCPNLSRSVFWAEPSHENENCISWASFLLVQALWNYSWVFFMPNIFIWMDIHFMNYFVNTSIPVQVKSVFQAQPFH